MVKQEQIQLFYILVNIYFFIVETVLNQISIFILIFISPGPFIHDKIKIFLFFVYLDNVISVKNFFRKIEGGFSNHLF